MSEVINKIRYRRPGTWQGLFCPSSLFPSTEQQPQPLVLRQPWLQPGGFWESSHSLGPALLAEAAVAGRPPATAPAGPQSRKVLQEEEEQPSRPVMKLLVTRMRDQTGLGNKACEVPRRASAQESPPPAPHPRLPQKRWEESALQLPSPPPFSVDTVSGEAVASRAGWAGLMRGESLYTSLPRQTQSSAF